MIANLIVNIQWNGDGSGCEPYILAVYETYRIVFCLKSERKYQQ